MVDGALRRCARDTLPAWHFDTPAAVKTLIDAGADEALAVAVARGARRPPVSWCSLG